MKLSNDEIAWIDKRMGSYAIIYQEIYDEITDHIITGIETARANGDNRDIEMIFDGVIATHFPGKKAIEKIQFKYVMAYDRKIRKTMLANMLYYFNIRAALATLVMIGIGFYLPVGKVTALIFWLLLIIIAAIPQVYVIRKLPKTKRDKKKMSLVRTFISSRARNLLLISNFIFIIIGFLARREHISFLDPANYHPAVFMLILSFFIIYSQSSMRLCRQELKLDLNQ